MQVCRSHRVIYLKPSYLERAPAMTSNATAKLTSPLVLGVFATLTVACKFTYPHKELQYYQLRYAKHVSFAATWSLDLQVAAAPV